jgi:hypothetical protein
MSQTSYFLARKYVRAAYRRQSKVKPLPCSAKQFFRSVQAAVLLRGGCNDIDQFFQSIEQAFATDRQLKAAGQQPTALKNLPEYRIFKRAIRDALDDQRLAPASMRLGVDLSFDEDKSDS